jgi:hypothetical protein
LANASLLLSKTLQVLSVGLFFVVFSAHFAKIIKRVKEYQHKSKNSV